MLDKLKTALVLVVIGGIAGLLIYATNELTYDDIMENRVLREQAYYKDIFGLEESIEIDFKSDSVTELLDEIVIYHDQDAVIGYIYKGSDTNNYGDIVILVGINLDGEITDVIITSSTNTAKYLNNIKSNFLSPFQGQSVDSLEFDSQTGATYTYGSVKKVVNAASEYYLENRGDE